MNRQVYYWCTVIVIAVVVVIGWLTVSNNGSASGNTNQIINESQQNVGAQDNNENSSMIRHISYQGYTPNNKIKWFGSYMDRYKVKNNMAKKD